MDLCDSRNSCSVYARRVLVSFNYYKQNYYFDNLMLHNPSFNDHLVPFQESPGKTAEHGLTAGPSKCFVALPSIMYLGFNLGEEAFNTLPNKVNAIKNMSVLGKRKQLRSLLGTLSFYRRFIPNLADLCIL